MKTAVITGATKGMGRAVAEKFASEAFSLAICARDKNELDTFSAYLNRQYGVDVFAMPCDMGVKEDINAFASAIKQRFDRLDVLVNNAGIYIPGTIEQEQDGAFEKQMAVNAGGPYHLTRGLIPLLLHTPHSHLFNICSVASIHPVVNAAAYTMSKYAVYGLTQLCREHFKNSKVKVTAVLPGSTLTNSWSGTDIAQNRFVQPHDVANAIWSAYNTSIGAVVEEIRILPQEGEV